MIIQLLSSHPAIQHSFGILVESFKTALVVSYVDGDTIIHHRFLDSEELALFMLKLIDGVRHIHSRSVLHNNLKASHVLVRREDGTPVITGFGNAFLVIDAYEISQDRSKDLGDTCLQRKDVREGKKPVSYATDLFCLGQLLSQIKVPRKPNFKKLVWEWVQEFASACRMNSSSKLSSLDFLKKSASELMKLKASFE